MMDHPGLQKLQAELRLIDQYLPDLASRAVLQDDEIIELNLEDINLSSFSHFPITISQFSSLQTLSLRNTNLKNLPEVVLQLSSLRSLDISHNHLQELSSLGQLTHLEELRASNNLIREFNHLPPKLELLDLANNSLERVPDQIADLTFLRKLVLAENHIHALDGQLSELQNLDYLNLRSNYLRSLPASIFTLNSLTKLNLYNNPISLPPNPAEREDLTIFVDRRAKGLSPHIRVLKPQVFDVRLSPRYPPTFQFTSVMFFGEEGSGKHTLLRKYIHSFYTPDQTLIVQQNRYLSWDHYIIEHQQHYYQLWYPHIQDLNDHNYTQGILNGFYYTTMICLVFDLSRPDSFRFILDAVRRILEIRHQPCPIFLVGNHFQGTTTFADSTWFQSITKRLAENINICYVELSARTGRNVKKLFDKIFTSPV